MHGLLAGSDAQRPLSTFDWAAQPSMSDDGSMVVYGESGEGSVTYGVYLRRAVSAAPVRLGDGWFPSLSHDVKWVSALSRERDALWVLPVGAGEARVLERGPIASYVGLAEWLPDSKRLVFTAFENGSTERHSYVQAINGPPKKLRRVMGRPSPDGTRCLCRDAGKFGGCHLDSDTFESIPNADDLTSAGWTVDGKAFYAYVRASKTFDVYRVDPATGVRNYIRPNLMRILPGAKIVDLPVDHPMFSIVYRINPLPQIPSLGSWMRTHQDSEIGPSTVHYYGVFDDHDRLVVLVSMNSDVSDSWEREGNNQDYFVTFSPKGYALGVNVWVYVMTH